MAFIYTLDTDQNAIINLPVGTGVDITVADGSRTIRIWNGDDTASGWRLLTTQQIEVLDTLEDGNIPT